MTITPLEYVKKEFADFEDMSHDDWLRKMQEFAVLQNSKINLEHILEMNYAKDKAAYMALKAATESLFFSDNSDYGNALCLVVSHLAKIDLNVLNEDIVKSIYYLLNPKQ